jgi:Alginate lyase/Exostosin family
MEEYNNRRSTTLLTTSKESFVSSSSSSMSSLSSSTTSITHSSSPKSMDTNHGDQSKTSPTLVSSNLRPKEEKQHHSSTQKDEETFRIRPPSLQDDPSAFPHSTSVEQTPKVITHNDAESKEEGPDRAGNKLDDSLLPSATAPPPTASLPSLPPASSFYKIGLVRAIGNALPPRHDANQTLRNLEFILKYEPDFERVHKHWVFNRIVDQGLLQKLLGLLEQYNQTSYTVIPFVLQDYAKTQYEFRKGHSWDELDMIHNKTFFTDGEYYDVDRSAYYDKIHDPKNLYVTNQNNARNIAMDWYMAPNATVEVDYVLPWDGNCFVTKAALIKLQQDLIRWNEDPVAAYNKSSNGAFDIDSSTSRLLKEPIKYFYTPMDRLLVGNEILLDPNYKPTLKEEPQLIFHRSAIGRFDPKLRYGKKNKVQMLLKLRIKGSWDDYHNKKPPTPFRDWVGPPPAAGWVSRLFSGKPELEEKNKSYRRGKARTDGMTRILSKLDVQVATKLYGWNASTWMFYDRTILAKEAAAWRELQQNATTAVNATRASNNSLHNLISILLEHANAAMSAGPWSVTDKQPCGCGKDNDCHDFYDVIGYKFHAANTSNDTAAAMCNSDDMRYDQSRLAAFQYNTSVLALAYTITGQRSFAERAAQNLVTWFVDPVTLMTPRLNVMWRSEKNQTFLTKYGVIEFKDVYFFLDAVRIVEESGALTSKQIAILRKWFETYLTWLFVAKDEKSRRGGLEAYFEPNHHGLYHDLQVISVASYVGNYPVAVSTMHESASRLLTHVSRSGKMFKELHSSNCEHWQMFTLQGWFTLARMARKIGVDTWSRFKILPNEELKSTEPQSALCRAAEYAIPLLRDRSICKKNQANMEVDISRWFPLYLEAQRHCPNLAVKYPNYMWPDWWPSEALTESNFGNAYRLNPLHSHQTAIAPFWNLGYSEFELDLDEAMEHRSPIQLPNTTRRDLSALSGHYNGYTNGTFAAPRIFVYDVLPAYQECLSRNKGALERYKTAYKHGGEVWWLEQVVSSPWRTFDKDAADLFVIPLLPGFVLYKKVCQDEAMETLRWIKRQATHHVSNAVKHPLQNHLLLTTHYVAEKPTINEWCPQCIHLHQENVYDAPTRHGDGVLTLSAPMLSQLYRSVANSTHQSTALSPSMTRKLRNQGIDDFLKSRPRAFYFAGQADNRKAYKGRTQVQRVWDALNQNITQKRNDSSGLREDFTFIITKHNPKYSKGSNSTSDVTVRDFNFTHDVATTRFGYQGRGDNPTSSRLFEWIDVGSIPVIIIDDAWLPGRQIPWKDFSIVISESLDDEALASEFKRIAFELPVEEMERMRSLLQEYAPSILWAAEDSVVAEVLLVDAWEAFQKERLMKVETNIDAAVS